MAISFFCAELSWFFVAEKLWFFGGICCYFILGGSEVSISFILCRDIVIFDFLQRCYNFAFGIRGVAILFQVRGAVAI